MKKISAVYPIHPEIIYINNGDNEQTWLNRVNLNHSVEYVRKDLYDDAKQSYESYRESLELLDRDFDSLLRDFKMLKNENKHLHNEVRHWRSK